MAPKKAANSRSPLNSNPARGSKTLTIPVIEEEAIVGRRIVETGKVRVSKRVTKRVEVIDEPLLREEVMVERVPVNRVVDQPPKVRYEGDLMIIPVVHEQVVLQKRLLLVEEIRIRKEVVKTHQPQSVDLRKEEIDVRRVAGRKRSGGDK